MRQYSNFHGDPCFDCRCGSKVAVFREVWRCNDCGATGPLETDQAMFEEFQLHVDAAPDREQSTRRAIECNLGGLSPEKSVSVTAAYQDIEQELQPASDSINRSLAAPPVVLLYQTIEQAHWRAYQIPPRDITVGHIADFMREKMATGEGAVQLDRSSCEAYGVDHGALSQAVFEVFTGNVKCRDLKVFRLTPSVVETVPAKDSTKSGRRFKRLGDNWDLMFDEAAFTMKNTKGMAYICLLLQSPDRPINALELSSAVGRTVPQRQLSAEELAGLSKSDGAGERVLEQDTLKRYRTLIKDLDGEIMQAEKANDLGTLEILRGESDALSEQIRHDAGLSGRIRNFSNPSERARKAVSNAITAALKNIGRHNAKMKEHFHDRIDCGNSFCYRGDGAEWEL